MVARAPVSAPPRAASFRRPGSASRRGASALRSVRVVLVGVTFVCIVYMGVVLVVITLVRVVRARRVVVRLMVVGVVLVVVTLVRVVDVARLAVMLVLVALMGIVGNRCDH